tara:strand:- start:313 stop:465 length:153 start_codon:yes stop_codon:yes gene_type:complete
MKKILSKMKESYTAHYATILRHHFYIKVILLGFYGTQFALAVTAAQGIVG